ncbi:phage virion morphogenesis protein [Pseudidiomarina aestuarii]|uniref:phage virion morphogenesis protein n=1 Tax=Pseudidiomarina aestuarii TaxID=624146 RepID=UPI003A96E1D5
MAGTRIVIDGSTAIISAAIRPLRDQSVNLAEPNAEVGEYLIESHQQRFREAVSPEGDAWAPLSEAYKAQSKRPSDILIEEGILMDTLNYKPGPAELLFGTPLEYGAAHQFGYQPRNLPARKWLGLSATDSEVIVQIFQAYLSEAF